MVEPSVRRPSAPHASDRPPFPNCDFRTGVFRPRDHQEAAHLRWLALVPFDHDSTQSTRSNREVVGRCSVPMRLVPCGKKVGAAPRVKGLIWIDVALGVLAGANGDLASVGSRVTALDERMRAPEIAAPLLRAGAGRRRNYQGGRQRDAVSHVWPLSFAGGWRRSPVSLLSRFATEPRFPSDEACSPVLWVARCRAPSNFLYAALCVLPGENGSTRAGSQTVTLGP